MGEGYLYLSVRSVSGTEGGSRVYRRRLIREIREWEFVYLLDCFHLFGVVCVRLKACVCGLVCQYLL
jgi:hypothetical protein